MPKEAKNADETRERIVQAATRLFVQHENCGVTMDELAHSMHISKRTLYETFKDKQELIDACCQSLYAAVGSFMSRISKQIDDPMMAIIFLIKVCALQTVKYGRLMQDLMTCYPAIHERYISNSRETSFQHILNALQKVHDKGDMLEIVNIASLSRVLSMLGPMCEAAHPDSTSKQILFLNLSTYLILRGALTAEAIVRYDNMEKELKQKLELMDENILGDKRRMDELLNESD